MSKLFKNLGKVALTIPLLIILFIVVIVDLIQIDSLFEQEIPFLFYPLFSIVYFLILWIIWKLSSGDLSDASDFDSFDGD